MSLLACEDKGLAKSGNKWGGPNSEAERILHICCHEGVV